MKNWNAKIILKNNFLLTFGLVLFASCAAKKPHLLNTGNNSSASEITEKYWKLKELNGKPVKMSAAQERELYFILKTDSLKLKGFAGCNYFTGNYQLMNSQKIKFSNFATGGKYCFIPTHEHEFLNALKSVGSFETKRDTLWLSSKNKTVARFEAVYF